MIHQSITKDGIFKFYRPNFKILILLAIFTLSQGNEGIQFRSSHSCVSSGRKCEDANSYCCDGLNCYKRSKRDFKRCVPCKDEGKPCRYDFHCCSYKCRNKVCTMKSTNTCNCDSMGTHDTLDDLNIYNAVDQWYEDKSSAEATYGKIECWNVEKVTSMRSLFGRKGNKNFNENLECWDTSSVTDMAGMFYGATSFNQNLNTWDVKHVTSMVSMFDNASSFNQDLNDWDVSKVNNMSSMFYGATNFNGDIANWNVNQVTMMADMFFYAKSFTDNLNEWDVSNVENMSGMFQSAENFNGDVSNWDVSNVNDMSSMFYETENFNGDISNWNVNQVTIMDYMFYYAKSFTGNLNEWDVSNVENMNCMFFNAKKFNGDVSCWDVSSVTSMKEMFQNAQSFDQSLSWDVSSKEVEGMFEGSAGCIKGPPASAATLATPTAIDKEKLVILQPEVENNPVSKSAPTNKVISVPNEICNNVLDAIGSTPMVRLNKVASELQCEIVVKCEFFNAGGSVKDRIGKRMVNDAEAQGKISPGDTLIEPTSGNTGIGLALASAVKNYRCIIVLPEKMSKEKVDVLKALGAEIIRTPTEAAYDAPDSHISVAKRLQTEIDNSYILDQYKNPSNPAAHYDDTAEEIWRQCDGKVDMIVCGAGTGGTISGIAKKLKEYNPNVIVVGVDPFGSILAQPDNLNEGHPIQPYQVEGIGYDFIPDVLDRTLIDRWYKSNDKDSLVMMRRLIRDEGLLCGGSSGSAVSIALHAAKSLKKGQRCVVMLPDSVRNYMTKALSDDWMVDHGFVDNDVIKQKRYDTCWWAEKHVSDIVMTTPLTITEDVTCREAILLLKEEGFDMVPVLNKDNEIVGVVTEGNMSSMILQGRIDKDASISEARSVMYKNFAKVKMNDKLSELAKWFDHEPFALVITEQRCYGYKRQQLKTSKGEETTNKHEREVVTKSVISGIVTRIDLLDFISQG